jgi:hypothetical protein
MPEPACPSCGAPITLAKDRNGNTVQLEKQPEPTGDGRFRVVTFGPPLIVEPLPRDSRVEGYPDHKIDCPAHGNGQR